MSDARPDDRYIFHICPQELWDNALRAGRYDGTPLDRRDGFIHHSSRATVVETAAVHLSGQTGLVLLTVDVSKLGDALLWEASRDGVLFPHLYGGLPLEAVVSVDPLPLDDDGRHAFPDLKV